MCLVLFWVGKALGQSTDLCASFGIRKFKKQKVCKWDLARMDESCLHRMGVEVVEPSSKFHLPLGVLGSTPCVHRGKNSQRKA